MIHPDDALNYLVGAIRRGNCDGYGYEVYLNGILSRYVAEHPEPLPSQTAGTYGRQSMEMRGRSNEREIELSPMFYAAAWELCRRGILRPGIRQMGAQATDDGGNGSGYSITPLGKKWFQEEAAQPIIPTDPDRYAEMLTGPANRFGLAFAARAQEAARCYHAHAFVACCAMCGAAASVMAHEIVNTLTADKKHANPIAAEDDMVDWLSTVSLPPQDRREVDAFLGLLSYWSSQSLKSEENIPTEREAYVALLLLLRFALYAGERW